MSHPLSRPPLLASLSSSSSQSSSSLYFLPGLERPLHSPGSSDRLSARRKSSNRSKPLPPVPLGHRRSSSDYSTVLSDTRYNSETFDRTSPSRSNFQTRPFSQSTPHLFEAERSGNPWFDDHVSLLDNTYDASELNNSTHARPILLEPKTFCPRSRQLVEQSGLPKRRVNAAEPALRHSTYSLESCSSGGSGGSDTSESFDGAPPRPASVQAVLQRSEHQRSASTERAKIALGVDSKTLAEESKRRRNLRLFNTLRQRSPLSLSSESIKLRLSSRPDDEYHLHVASQSLHDKPTMSISQPSPDPVPRPLSGPLVPAPLFAHMPRSRGKVSSAHISSTPPPLPPPPVLSPEPPGSSPGRRRSKSASPVHTFGQRAHGKSSSSSAWSLNPFAKSNESPRSLRASKRASVSNRNEQVTGGIGHKPVKQTRSQKKKHRQREALKASIRHVALESD